MTAWVVRAGKQGENEHWNLAHGFASVGWIEVGDLSACRSREDVRALVDEAYPADPPTRQANFAGQLWSFRGSVAPGDLVVMPSKVQRGYLRFGRVTGGYVYDAHEPDKTRRHRVPVQWDETPSRRPSWSRTSSTPSMAHSPCSSPAVTTRHDVSTSSRGRDVTRDAQTGRRRLRPAS